ncbi:hypothetical protein F4801DRAFT_364234 [Xylaria longipes]|nr:hypothetical protein F4801DRAFT_364234 [Xylaria longipes]
MLHRRPVFTPLASIIIVRLLMEGPSTPVNSTKLLHSVRPGLDRACIGGSICAILRRSALSFDRIRGSVSYQCSSYIFTLGSVVSVSCHNRASLHCFAYVRTSQWCHVCQWRGSFAASTLVCKCIDTASSIAIRRPGRIAISQLQCMSSRPLRRPEKPRQLSDKGRRCNPEPSFAVSPGFQKSSHTYTQIG